MSADNKVLTLAALLGAAWWISGRLATVADRNIDVPSDGAGGPGLFNQVANVLGGSMKYSDQGLQLTERAEAAGGPNLTAYWDSYGQVWTIGYGHTGSDVYQGMVIDAGTAADMLRSDIAAAEATVNRLVSVSLTQGQFDALVDFVYNVGSGNFASSTLLSDVNSGNLADVGAQLARWNHAGGNVLAGLTARRAAEAAEFYA